jgi:hypothetical protein
MSALAKIASGPLAQRILKMDWEKVALAAIVTLALANILIFVRERGGK